MRYIYSLYYSFIYYFYFFLTFTKISLPQNITDVIKQPKITILVELESSITNKSLLEMSFTYRKVKMAINDILYDEKQNNILLNAQIIPLFNTSKSKKTMNRLQITRDIVCQQLLSESAAIVLVQHVAPYDSNVVREIFSTAAYALGFYGVPTIGVMIRDAEFSRKNLYPTFLRTSPPFSHEAYAIVRLLETLAYRQVIVIIVNGDLNGQEFVILFDELSKSAKIHVQRYIKLNANSLEQQLEQDIIDTTANTIVLYTKSSIAEKIFDIITNFSAIADRLWIVNEAATKARNLPTGVLSVRQRQSVISALRDALAVLRDGISFLNYSTGVRPPFNCLRDAIHDDVWTTSVGPLFYKKLISTTFHGEENLIHFNEKGDRILVAFDILNMHQGGFNTIVGHMSERGEMTLEESLIHWSRDGSLQRPLEITLPRYLRVVGVEDPPFIYTLPNHSGKNCTNYNSLLIDNIEVGPWLSCRKFSNESRNASDSLKEVTHCCAGYAIDLLSNLSISDIKNYIDTSFMFDIHLNESYGAVLLNSDTNFDDTTGTSSKHHGTVLSNDNHGYRLSGMLGELDADTADLAIGAFTINPEREKYIDFSEPWHYHGIRILEKWKPRDSPMQSFLQPLKNTLWTAIFASVFFIGCAIFLLDLNSPFDFFFDSPNVFRLTKCDGPDDETRVNFGEAMWFTWGVLLNSGVCEKTPRSFSARVLGLAWCGFCMIIVASYTANLAAFLVLDQPVRNLNGITDSRLRNPRANFSYATVLHTNTYQYFKRHVELSTIFRKMERHNVRYASDAINALLNDTLDAFIWDSIRTDYEAARHCELRTGGALFGRSAYGIGLRKNSPWTPHITEKILRLSETGLMERLESKWIFSATGQKKSCSQDNDKAPARLGLRSMRDGLILVIVGMSVGTLLSIVEVRIGRLREQQKRREFLAKRCAEKWFRLTKRRRRFFHFSLIHLASDNNDSSRVSTQNGNSFSHERHPQNNLQNNPENNLSILKREKINFIPNLNFNTKSCRLYCSRCHAIVETDVRPCIGIFAICASIFFILTLLWPCALLPYFITLFADYAHYCPQCGHFQGRYRRFIQGPRFYV